MWLHFHISVCLSKGKGYVCVFVSLGAKMRWEKRKIMKNTLDSLCSSLCCKRLWTCQSPLSWPAGFLLPGSSWLPSLCGQSAGRPGRPCQQQSVGQCAASGTGWAPPGYCADRLPSALHQDHGTCTQNHFIRIKSIKPLDNYFKYIWCM